MRLVSVGGIIAAALFFATAMPSHAASWPARCHSMRCVNAHLDNLDQRQQASSARVTALTLRVSDLETVTNRLESRLGCIASEKAWQQYSYDTNGNVFTYLDVTRDYGSGTYTGPYWFLVDTCGVF